MGLIVHERAQERVRGIIEEVAAQKAEPGTPEQKVGDYFASWMETEVLDSLGIGPLQEDLDRIAGIDSLAGLTAEFGRASYVSGMRPITAGIGIDPKNPDRYDPGVGLGGMGLPDRDYYLDESERFTSTSRGFASETSPPFRFGAMTR